MMTEPNSIFHLERIRKYFLDRELAPLAHDQYIALLGGFLTDYFQTIMNILLPQQVSVLCGYYANDVKTEQKHVRKFYQAPDNQPTVILVNAMLYRFLQDIYLLHEPEPYKQVLGMFRKYLPLLVGSPSEEIQHFLSSYTPPDLEADKKDLTRCLNLAFVSTTFTLIHESVHLDPEFYQTSVQLIRSSTHFDDLDETSIQELACDFSAFYLMLGQDMPIRRILCERMHFSVEELACCAFVALHAETLYQLFRDSLYLGNRRSADMEELIHSPLTTRIKNLCIAAKITINTPSMAFQIGALNLTAALNFYSKVVLNFLTGCAAAYDIFAEIARKSEEIGVNLQIDLNEPIAPDSVWFRVGS